MPFVVKLIVRKRAVCRPACEFILGLGAALAAVTLLPLEHRVGVRRGHGTTTVHLCSTSMLLRCYITNRSYQAVEVCRLDRFLESIFTKWSLMVDNVVLWKICGKRVHGKHAKTNCCQRERVSLISKSDQQTFACIQHRHSSGPRCQPAMPFR